MASLLDIGRSAIQSQREALNVTGQNIANVNTEGYRRRDGALQEIAGSQSELVAKSSQSGLGVRLGEIRRAYNSFLAESSRNAVSRFEAADAFVGQIVQLENLILPRDGDLGSVMSAFFTNLTDVAAQPGDLAPRAAAIEQGQTLANSFNVTAEVLEDLTRQTVGDIEIAVQEINQFTNGLAEVNARLRSSNLGGTPPNALLDERDRLLAEISERAAITVSFGARYEAEVRLGRSEAGPVLVQGENAPTLSVARTEDGGLLFRLGAGQVVGTPEAGRLRGLADALEANRRALSELDALARRVTDEMNALHEAGIDLDGQFGQPMFTSADFDVAAAVGNSGTAQLELLQVPGENDRLDALQVSYNARTDAWTARNTDGVAIGSGRRTITLEGAVLNFEGRPADGDTFTLTRASGDAGRLRFLLTRPQELAAASTVIVTPESTNTGTATLATTPGSIAPAPLPAINTVLANNLSPVTATDFRRDGVVAVIPAGARTVELASLESQSTLSVSLPDSGVIATVAFEIGGTSYTLSASGANANIELDWGDPAEIASLLDLGALEVSDGSNEFRLADLGVHAAGSASGLTFALDRSMGDFGPGSVSYSIMAEDGTLGSDLTAAADVRAGQDASGIQIFTREGRQVAGAPLSADEVEDLFNATNGFLPEAEYRADYLNGAGGVGYRGMQVERFVPQGLKTATLALPTSGGSWTAGALTEGSPPLNPTQSQTLTVSLTDAGTARSFSVPAGVPADFVATALAQELEPLGVDVAALTRAEISLADPPATGDEGFTLVGLNREPIGFSANVDQGFALLAGQINARTAETGITAEISRDGSRLILEQDSGADIVIAGAPSPGLLVAALGADYAPISGDDGAATDGGEARALSADTRIGGQITLSSATGFSVESTVAGAGVRIGAADPMAGGLVGRDFSQAGSVAALSFAANAAVDTSAASADGTRAQSASAEYTLDIAVDGGTDTLTVTISSADLAQLDSAHIATALAAEARAQAPVPVLTSATLTALPANGTTASFTLGAAEYTLTMQEGLPVVSGPEPGRVRATLNTDTSASPATYQITLAVTGGALSGAGLTPVNAANASLFGLDAASSTASLEGRAFDGSALGGATSLTATLNGTSYTISRAADGTYTLSNGAGTTDTGTSGTLSVGDLSLTITDEGTTAERLSLAGAAGTGPIAITGSTGAGELGFQVADADLEVTPEGLTARSVTGAALAISGTGSSLAAERIRLSDLPAEELIVVMAGDGARRLSASYDIPPPSSIIPEPETFEVRMVDQAAGKVELFDTATGHSIATRITAGATTFDIAGLSLELSGFPDTGDSFQVATNRRATGDARNMDAIVALGQSVAGRASFQDDFRAIAAGVGSTLEAARLSQTSAEAMRDAAVSAEDEISGVNLDEEAARLIEQQQAYQAAARILQTAREMFDTLINIG